MNRTAAHTQSKPLNVCVGVTLASGHIARRAWGRDGLYTLTTSHQTRLGVHASEPIRRIVSPMPACSRLRHTA